jgi:hypothetical protein
MAPHVSGARRTAAQQAPDHPRSRQACLHRRPAAPEESGLADKACSQHSMQAVNDGHMCPECVHGIHTMPSFES